VPRTCSRSRAHSTRSSGLPASGSTPISTRSRHEQHFCRSPSGRRHPLPRF
jgi:hypothetical protein